jgi:hypothetical protein
MYILPPGPVSLMESRIPPAFIIPIAALVQLPGCAVFTYYKIAINDYSNLLK